MADEHIGSPDQLLAYTGLPPNVHYASYRNLPDDKRPFRGNILYEKHVIRGGEADLQELAATRGARPDRSPIRAAAGVLGPSPKGKGQSKPGANEEEMPLAMQGLPNNAMDTGWDQHGALPPVEIPSVANPAKKRKTAGTNVAQQNNRRKPANKDDSPDGSNSRKLRDQKRGGKRERAKNASLARGEASVSADRTDRSGEQIASAATKAQNEEETKPNEEDAQNTDAETTEYASLDWEKMQETQHTTPMAEEEEVKVDHGVEPENLGQNQSIDQDQNSEVEMEQNLSQHQTEYMIIDSRENDSATDSANQIDKDSDQNDFRQESDVQTDITQNKREVIFKNPTDQASMDAQSTTEKAESGKEGDEKENQKDGKSRIPQPPKVARSGFQRSKTHKVLKPKVTGGAQQHTTAETAKIPKKGPHLKHHETGQKPKSFKKGQQSLETVKNGENSVNPENGQNTADPENGQNTADPENEENSATLANGKNPGNKSFENPEDENSEILGLSAHPNLDPTNLDLDIELIRACIEDDFYPWLAQEVQLHVQHHMHVTLLRDAVLSELKESREAAGTWLKKMLQ